MSIAILLAVVAVLLAPLAFAVGRHRATAGALLLFLLFTRASDIGISGHGVGSVSDAGLSQVSQFVLAGLVLIALIRSVRRWRAGGSGDTVAPWLGVALYLAVVLASELWAPDGGLASSQAVSLLKSLAIMFVIADLLDSPRALRIASWGCVVAGGAMSALTIAQAVTNTSSRPFLGFAQAPVRQIVGTDNSFRSAGPIGDPNFYALVLAIVLPIALVRMRDERRPSLRVVAGTTALLLVGAIALTYSRGGLVAAVVAIAGFALLTRPRGRNVAIAALVALALVPALPANYIARIGSLATGDHSIAGRAASQDVAIAMFVDHPVGGIGANNYGAAYRSYAVRGNEPAAAENPHNLYLAIAAETGLLGLGAFLAAMLLTVRVAWRRRAAAVAVGEREQEGLATAFLLAIATYLVGVAFLPIAYPRYLWMLVGLVLAGSVPRLARVSHLPAATLA